MRSDFLFKLLDGIGPVDRFGRLIVIGDVLVERGFQGRGTDKMIGLQMFALQDTEPDFDLIQPGRIGRQPMQLEVQSPVTGAFLLLEPAFELLRRVGGAIVQDEGHRVDPPPKGFGNDHLLEKGLEIDKALALAAGSVDLAISHGQSGKQMACTTTMIPCFMEHRLAWACWARRLFPLACLDGSFLIQTDQPRACRPRGLAPEHRLPTRGAPVARRRQDHGCAARHDSARDEGVPRGSCDPPYWPRCEEASGLGPRVGPVRLDSTARGAPGTAWASYRRWP